MQASSQEQCRIGSNAALGGSPGSLHKLSVTTGAAVRDGRPQNRPPTEQAAHRTGRPQNRPPVGRATVPSVWAVVPDDRVQGGAAVRDGRPQNRPPVGRATVPSVWAVVPDDRVQGGAAVRDGRPQNRPPTEQAACGAGDRSVRVGGRPRRPRSGSPSIPGLELNRNLDVG